MNPCIFDFATRELSQDAFFCWLLSWADSKYKNDLNKIANNIISKIVDKCIMVEKIEIFRQKKDIDFYIIINEKIIIVFEDKVKTSFHDNQLERYKEIMFEQFKDYDFYFVYIKNDLVFPSEKCEVEKNGYKVIDIFQINNFCNRSINNDIYNDYSTYLKKKIFKYDNFCKIKFSLWGQDEWLGFIYHLVNEEQIEYEKHDIWQGRELWFMLNEKEISNKNYWLRLEIKHSMTNNYGRLAILLHIEDKRLSKSKIKEDAINRLMKMYKNENVNKNNHIGYHSVVIDFNDFPIRNRKGYVDYDKTKKYLYKVISIFNQKAI